MKHLPIVLLAVMSLATAACGKKTAETKADEPSKMEDKAATKPVDKAGDKPGDKAGDKPATPGGAAKAAVELPPECKEFTAAFEALTKCEKLGPAREEMKKGYDQMLKAMIDLGDQKAMADGCKQGIDGLKQALTTAGC